MSTPGPYSPHVSPAPCLGPDYGCSPLEGRHVEGCPVGDAEAQRRSFAYGNLALSDPTVTRADVDAAAERIFRNENRGENRPPGDEKLTDPAVMIEGEVPVTDPPPQPAAGRPGEAALGVGTQVVGVATGVDALRAFVKEL